MQVYRSSDWKAFRQRIIVLYDHVCVRCGRGSVDGVTLQAHHKHYIAGRQPWDYPLEACEALCQGCHAAEHGKIPPKQGWEFHGFSDLGDLSGVCDLCGTAYRYAFMVSHPDWRAMEVGEICCDNLTSTETATGFMEDRRKRADKKKRFVQSMRWSVPKNGIHRITQEKIPVEIRQECEGYRLRVGGVTGRRLFNGLLEAKIYAFEFIDSGRARVFMEERKRRLCRELIESRH